MKKLLLILVGVIIGGGGYHVYSGFSAGAEMGEDYVEKSLSGAEISEGLVSTDLDTRTAAFNQIGKLPDAEKKAALFAALAATYAPTRIGAISVLGRDLPTDPEVIPKLMEAAGKDPDCDVQAAAFAALQKSGDKRVLAMALKTLESEGCGLESRLEAVRTLDKLTGQSTCDAFRDHMEGAAGAADDLMLEWTDWLDENRAKLAWDLKTSVFK